MSDDDREYEFYPEDFEGEEPTGRRGERAPLVIAACIGVGALLFLAEPVVEARTVAGLEFSPIVPSALVLAFGLLVGASVYVRRGERSLGYAHGIGGVGWLFVLLGTLLSSTTLLVAGAGVLGVGAVTLVVLVFR